MITIPIWLFALMLLASLVVAGITIVLVVFHLFLSERPNDEWRTEHRTKVS